MSKNVSSFFSILRNIANTILSKIFVLSAGSLKKSVFKRIHFFYALYFDHRRTLSEASDVLSFPK